MYAILQFITIKYVKFIYNVAFIMCRMVKKPKYVGINIPVGLAQVLDEIVKKEGIYGSRAALVKHLIQDWIESYRKERMLQK